MKALNQLVARKIAVMFPPAVHDRVAKELLKYGGESTRPQVERVRLAILKLSNGQMDELNIAGALEDPVDIINWAEQPALMQMAMENRKLKPQEHQNLEAQDWAQYHEWLAEGMK